MNGEGDLGLSVRIGVQSQTLRVEGLDQGLGWRVCNGRWKM